MLAGYSILGFYPVEVYAFFQVHKRLEIDLPNLWLFRGVVHWAATDGRPQHWM